MKEKDIKHTPTPGLPEALHPEIGNGAAFAENKHDFILLSVDPTKGLEDLLPKTELIIPDLVEEKAKQAEKEVTSKSDKEVKSEGAPAANQTQASSSTSSTPPAEEKKEENAPSVISKKEALPVKSSKISKPRKIQKEKSVKLEETPEMIQTPSVKAPAKESDTETEAEEKKAPKPGKRIRKAAKAVQKQQENKKKLIKKTPAKKAPAKKAPAKKVPVKEVPVIKEPFKKAPVKEAPDQKIAAKTTPTKKVAPKNVPKREKFSLSPFTQWLKELGGADYVHPYDDDFAISQEKGPLNEVISETYANLLAAQGYTERAIAMYLKLIEKYPEKSSFFAAKIEALQ